MASRDRLRLSFSVVPQESGDYSGRVVCGKQSVCWIFFAFFAGWLVAGWTRDAFFVLRQFVNIVPTAVWLWFLLLLLLLLLLLASFAVVGPFVCNDLSSSFARRTEGCESSVRSSRFGLFRFGRCAAVGVSLEFRPSVTCGRRIATCASRASGWARASSRPSSAGRRIGWRGATTEPRSMKPRTLSRTTARMRRSC